ncbi:hypothetical protein L1887_18075 [Cichorium endivia]|nr:hypothetical protein L1887_18075 [Cichorium endivia]
MSSSGVHLEKFVIPLEEILLATQNFSPKTQISEGELGVAYKGQLQNCTITINRHIPHANLGDREFYNELKIISTFHHHNIIPFIGYCDEINERITVSEYAVNGSLAEHLEDPNKMRILTWADRLIKICIGAAKGLEYLHSGLGKDSRVIHRDVKSANILLDHNLEAKICNFNLSILVEPCQEKDYIPIAGTHIYMDPIYEQSGIVKTESDVYSFGVVLFEMLSGMPAYHKRRIEGEQPQRLINLVRRHYVEGPHNLIDPHIRDQITARSFNMFRETAYECISWNSKARPKMDMIIKRIEKALDFQNRHPSSTVTIQSLQYKNLESFLIPLEEISLATRHFSSENRINKRGFCDVYRGQLSEEWQNRTAVFKRYREKLPFLTELKMMSNFKHESIIPFIGYCDEQYEMVIVVEFASNRSLDHHLQDTSKLSCLTWAHRLKICMGAARGLEYLHSGLGENMVVIHRDMKSSSILLDDNLEPKICGFGLSLLIDQNEPQVYEVAAGTEFYIDPIYKESGMVNTGSDVYSFGMVLFEMLTGMPAFHKRRIGDDQPQKLLTLVQRYCDDGLDKLIDPHIRDQINIHSLYTFKKIASRCISMNLNDRPPMKRIFRRIEEALMYQNHGTAYSITTRSLEKGHRNQESSQIFTKAAGTNFYMDPIYNASGVLGKESDVYSFGVVLFEMLSGRLAYDLIKFVDGNPQFLINLVRHYYENGPEKFIDPDIRDEIDSRSFHTFKEVAYQCISFISRERPTMEIVIEKIEDAIDFQAVPPITLYSQPRFISLQ